MMKCAFSLFWLLLKVQRWLFGLAWRLFLLLYFSVGLGALGVLFLLEAEFFFQLTRYALLGYGIAAIFEVTKVGTSVIKQALLIAGRVRRIRVSPLICAVTTVLQFILILVTLFCSTAVITSYLDGSAVVEPAARHQAERLQPALASTLLLLEDGLRLKVRPSTFISVFALSLGALFQGVVYIVFGHVLATQSSEIEHLFEVKMQRLDVKKNFTSNR